VIAGELLRDRAAQQPEIGGCPQEAGRNPVASSVRPFVFGDPSAFAKRVEVGRELVGADAIRAVLERLEQPDLQEVPEEKLVPGHVPEGDRAPFIQQTAALRQDDQCPGS
jgi:hypothetical protein